VMVTGMHIQAEQINDIRRRAAAGRQGHGAGRALGLGLAGDVPGLRLSASGRARRRHRCDHPADRREPGAARRPDGAQHQGSACRSPISRSPPTTPFRSGATCSAPYSSPRAAPIPASSATFPASTAASRA
jgi:hypothetical protein